MFKKRFRNKASAGFAHHFGLAALLLIVGFAIYGTYQLVASHADSFSFSVQTATGCRVAGRVWDSADSKCTKTCTNSNTTYVANGPGQSYCQGAVVMDISLSECTNTLHRRYVENVGCGRRADRVSTDNAVQCQNAYPNYQVVTGSSPDKCVVKSVVASTSTSPPPPRTTTTVTSNATNTTSTTSSTGGSTSSGTTSVSSSSGKVTSDPISRSVCTTLLGRIYTNNTCQRACQPINANTTTLLPVPAPDNKICNGWISTDLSQAHCTVNLHRVWRDNGCLRHMPQVDISGAAQCAAGYPYYNANFTSPERKTGTDVCEKSAAAAKYNEAHNILGTPELSATFGSSATTNDTGCTKSEASCTPGHNQPSGGSTPTTGTTTDPTVPPQSGNSTTVKVEDLSRNVCDLLGREWVPAGKGTDGTKQAAGCSTQSCYKNNVDLHKRNGSFYCDGYATGAISQQKCGDLHRKWISAVNACASRPNQDAKAGKRVISAEQCTGSYSTYVFRTDQYDECLKPDTVDNLKNVARVANLPFVKVTTLSRAGLCNVQPHKHWDGHSCVKDQAIKHVSGTTSSSSNNTSSSSSVPALTASGCAAHHRKYTNGTCTKVCNTAGYVLATANPYDYCRKKGSSTPAPTSSFCSNPDHAAQCASGGSTYCSSPDHAAQCQTGSSQSYRTVNIKDCGQFISITHSGSRFKCPRHFIITYCPGDTSAVSATVTVGYTRYHISQICE